MCEICSTFNPFRGDWLHVGETLPNAQQPPASARWSGADRTGTLTTATLEDEATSQGRSSASGSLPTYSVEKVADILLYGAWNGHGGDPWYHDIDLADPGARLLHVDFGAMTQAGQWFAQEALDAWTAATGIRFSTAPRPGGKDAHISFDDENSGARTFTTAWSTGEIVSTRVNVSKSWIDGDEYEHDAYSLRTFVHEIGHALGLGHPGDYSRARNGGDDFGTDASFANDSWQYTVMSYFSQTENSALDASHAYVLTPQIADIVAIRELYGTTGTLRTGDTTYGVGSTAGDFYDRLEDNWSSMAFTIVDDGGVDWLDFSATSRDQVVDLRPGAFSSVGKQVDNMAIAPGTKIEHFRSGAGDDKVLGNGLKNRLEGGDGRDRLDGAGGGDTLLGQAGNDTLLGGGGYDKLLGGGGADVLKGGAGQDALFGHGGTDKLLGGDANDTLSGGDGRDRLFGEAGADRLNGNAHADALFGGQGADKLFGGAGGDTLKGGAGKDLLAGGAGRDTLLGGAGRDTFRFLPGDGRDVIGDWQSGLDRLDLSAWGLTSVKAVKALAEQRAGGLELTLSANDVLWLDGAGMEALSGSALVLAVA